MASSDEPLNEKILISNCFKKKYPDVPEYVLRGFLELSEYDIWRTVSYLERRNICFIEEKVDLSLIKDFIRTELVAVPATLAETPLDVPLSVFFNLHSEYDYSISSIILSLKFSLDLFFKTRFKDLSSNDLILVFNFEGIQWKEFRYNLIFIIFQFVQSCYPLKVPQILFYRTPLWVSLFSRLAFLWSPYSNSSLLEMIDYSKDLTRFSPCLPSSLGGTVYSGPILLRNLASQYGNTQTTMLDELYGRLDLSLESLATPDSLLDELGVTGHIEHGHSDKELFEKFQRRESDPLALQKNFEKEFYLQK